MFDSHMNDSSVKSEMYPYTVTSINLKVEIYPEILISQSKLSGT